MAAELWTHLLSRALASQSTCVYLVTAQSLLSGIKVTEEGFDEEKCRIIRTNNGKDEGKHQYKFKTQFTMYLSYDENTIRHQIIP
jgi:hypothetical protein